MTPFFTIATISYNSSKWICQAIDSILASSCLDFELLISDDASTDDTWSKISAYTDPRIRAYRNEKNIGEYANRNKVLQLAKGRYIFYIDGDDILYKDSLHNLKQFLCEFSDADMVWGVPVHELDFAVLPYLLSPEQVTRLMFFTPLTITAIGLAETVFRVEALRAAGGFSTAYAIGDTFIKRKMALSCKTLFVPTGLSFWRRSSNQASQKAAKKYRSFIDLYRINQVLLYQESLLLSAEELMQARKNIRISEIKLLLSTTLLRGRVRDFFFLKKTLKVSFPEFLYAFQKGWFGYKIVADIGEPLKNGYNFSGEPASVVH